MYQTTPGRTGWDVRACAAFLAVQSPGTEVDAALVGRSAAHVRGLVRAAPPVIEIGVPHRRRVDAPPGTRIRRMTRFHDALDDTAYPWRTATAVTVVDCAGQGDEDAALALVGRAVQSGLVSSTSLATELARRRGHRHGGLLREVLGDVGDGTHSAAEIRYVRDVERAHGLPGGRRQVARDRGATHDTVYEAYATVVEVDGRLGHERWSERVRDGRRDRLAAGEGEFTTRVFWPDVALTPCRTAIEVGAVLAARGWPGRPGPCRRAGCAVRG
ncbi:hypothetical protein [Phycicoccus sonneratiae]|uniref:hypothetical protein n=1 Tax=Phycicoccus sonneratiae TaxID=2807628 RepID=UPI001EF293EE|nr:hypothetical protein [Phycicoccus sonneraticus]